MSAKAFARPAVSDVRLEALARIDRPADAVRSGRGAGRREPWPEPGGSRDPVGLSPAPNNTGSVSSLSASDTAAHVIAAAPS